MDQSTPQEVELWNKVLLTLPEASKLSGIGINRLRQICLSPDANFIIWIGDRKMIKRSKFIEYLEAAYSL